MKTKTKTKNQKISHSLKRHYKREKAIIDAKAVIGLVIIIATMGIIFESMKPIALANDNDRHNFLPINEDKKDLTDKDELFIEAHKLCYKKGLDDNCIKDLLAIAWVESRFDCSVVGDFGASHGCFQIHQGFNKHIRQDQAEDAEFAVEWTLNRMVHYGYPENRSYAIRRHNGSPDNPKTLQYLNKVNSYLKYNY